MGLPSGGTIINFIVIGLFVVYMGQVAMTMYELFNPEACVPGKGTRCVTPHQKADSQFELRLYTSLSVSKTVREKDLMLAHREKQLDLTDDREISVNITLPLRTLNNGTLYAYVFLHPRGTSPFRDREVTVYQIAPLTKYTVPKAEAFNLLKEDDQQGNSTADEIPTAHWKSKLPIRVMQDPIPFHQQAIPNELYQLMRFTKNAEYLPILYVHELAQKNIELVPINRSIPEMTLNIVYSPISVGQLRLYVSLQHSMKMLQDFGFGEKDVEEVKSLFTDTGLYLLGLTVLVSMFHILFDFLAFKNDISYWKKRDTMVGLSIRTIVWRSISQIVIFLYLLDQDTSLLVLVPAGIGTVIEVWKVKKAFKLHISWSGWKPSVSFGTSTDSEKETQEFDKKAMKYLSYLLYPLCVAGALYSLIYVPHKSWYSWLINSLVNGVYAFGFLFMLPQLFVNYKLKSVAHLPWRAFMYKAFNTFIDDMFAFIITMPTAHRLACFRDDFVFLIYLYQRWLYPVDKTRVNEYGMSYEEKPATTVPSQEEKTHKD
ncbi:lipid scramblase CLPTM1L-like [Amphiura filiformis]|uniref:lipid scramblase CLPTM1L-like n=1 Tax=Amphiura filiformis TaxID=82378 RepID=UPI003B20CCAE